MAHLHHRHLGTLPTQLHILIHARLASTAAPGPRAQFPYPTNPRPTPHQIFHLPYGASQQDVKARYYDLVRTHHPDSAHCRSLPPSVRHARFQSITAAYDHLRGKASLDSRYDPFAEEIARRKRFYYAAHNRRAEYANTGGQNWNASPDDRWKDRLIFIVGIITLAAGLAPGLFLLPFQMDKRHRAAASNLAQARNEAKELGDERRKELRKRVKDIKAAESRLGVETGNKTKDDV